MRGLGKCGKGITARFYIAIYYTKRCGDPNPLLPLSNIIGNKGHPILAIFFGLSTPAKKHSLAQHQRAPLTNATELRYGECSTANATLCTISTPSFPTLKPGVLG